MAVTKKDIDLTPTDYASAQNYAESKVGTWMNMLNAISFNEVDHKYHMPPIQYSDVNLEGEKIKFASGQEFTVIFSCLASEYKNKKEVYDAWWNKAKELKKAYEEQIKIDSHIASHNTDLKKLRKEGQLLNKEELENDGNDK